MLAVVFHDRFHHAPALSCHAFASVNRSVGSCSGRERFSSARRVAEKLLGVNTGDVARLADDCSRCRESCANCCLATASRPLSTVRSAARIVGLSRGHRLYCATCPQEPLRLEECLHGVLLLGLNQAVDPCAGWWHAPHRDLERRDADRVFEVDLVGLARHPSTESQIAGEGFGAIPMIALQSCSQRSSLAGSPGSRTISSAKLSGSRS